MIPSLKISEFLNQYQQKLELTFASAEIGLEQEIKNSRPADKMADFFPYGHTETRR